MKDDFMQGFENDKTNDNNSAHPAADELKKYRSAEDSRKEKVKNFTVHLDGDESDTQSANDSKDIYSSSNMRPKSEKNQFGENLKDFMVSDSMAARYGVAEQETGIDIAAHGEKRDVQPKTAKRVAEKAPEKRRRRRNNKWPERKNSHKKGGGCLKGFFIATIVAVCAIILSWYTISCANDLLGLLKTEAEVSVTIPKGATTEDVAVILKDKGLIDQELFFKIFTDFKYRKETKFPGYIAGDYKLYGKMGYEGMVNTIKYPPNEEKTVMLTFPEGKSLMDIAKMLEEADVCTVEGFVKAVNEGEYDYKLIRAIPEDERFYKLEGYIFPDTYEFYIHENPKSVVNRFVKNAQDRISSSLRKRAEEMDMTMDEVITLASIIQKEASDPNEMGKVSSVFHNRLKKPNTYPLLQSDPTIFYVENDIIPYLSDASQRDKYAELYNTYKCIGLPIAPISSPGLEAIRAALYPDKTGYYYFVTDKNNKYYYARTNSEHESNIAKVERVNKKIEEAAANAGAED